MLKEESCSGVTVMEVLRQGLATPEHAAFVRQLQERRATSYNTLLQA